MYRVLDSYMHGFKMFPGVKLFRTDSSTLLRLGGVLRLHKLLVHLVVTSTCLLMPLYCSMSFLTGCKENSN